jgi:hypothetical protein
MPAGTHTVAISNDTGILANDRITNDSVVKVSLTLGNNLVLASEALLTVCITLFVEKNLISEIDKPEALLRFVILPVMVLVNLTI